MTKGHTGTSTETFVHYCRQPRLAGLETVDSRIASVVRSTARGNVRADADSRASAVTGQSSRISPQRAWHRSSGPAKKSSTLADRSAEKFLCSIQLTVPGTTVAHFARASRSRIAMTQATTRPSSAQARGDRRADRRAS